MNRQQKTTSDGKQSASELVRDGNDSQSNEPADVLEFQRFLETLPGVGAHCKYKIMRRFSNLKELLTAEENVLQDILESRENTTLFMQTVQLPFERRGKKRPAE